MRMNRGFILTIISICGIVSCSEKPNSKLPQGKDYRMDTETRAMLENAIAKYPELLRQNAESRKALRDLYKSAIARADPQHREEIETTYQELFKLQDENSKQMELDHKQMQAQLEEDDRRGKE